MEFRRVLFRSVLHTAVPEDLARALENSDDWNRVAAILSRVQNTGIDAHAAAASAATATARRFPQTVIDFARSTPTTPRHDTADLPALPLPPPAIGRAPCRDRVGQNV